MLYKLGYIEVCHSKWLGQTVQSQSQNIMKDSIIDQLAPTGVLRAGINLSNFLLVSSNTPEKGPVGVSPDMAMALADKLGVDVKLITYKNPGDVADAATQNEWDIANIAAEAQRAKVINFSTAYCEIQATYLLPPNSLIRSVADVDRKGIRIAVKERAAYDLWLTENLTNATLVRAASMDDSFDLFQEQSLEVLAGLRPRLLCDAEKIPGSILMVDSFTAVQQSIGCQPGRAAAAQFVQEFVQESIASGLVESLIQKHNVKGKLSVANSS